MNAFDRRLARKVVKHRSSHSPNIVPGDCSVARGTLAGQPRLRITTGAFHHVPYYKWRAPNVIESFMERGASRPITWRRHAAQSGDVTRGLKHWARPNVQLPIDGAARGLAMDLSNKMGCHVHVVLLDAQWYMGGPKAKVPSSRFAYRFNRNPWYKKGRGVAHAAMWLGSPKIRVDFMAPFAQKDDRQHQHIMKFCVAMAKMYTGPGSFLKGVRVEFKGRMKVKGRGRARFFRRTAGFGDSMVNDFCGVRSYREYVTAKKGVVSIRVQFFYTTFAVKGESIAEEMTRWMDDPSITYFTKNKEERTALRKWKKWVRTTSALLKSWEMERFHAPTKDLWGFEIETLSQHLDLFRKRGLKRFGFWNRSREHPKRSFHAGGQTWNSVAFGGWSSPLAPKEPWTRRMEEFSGTLPAVLNRALPAALDTKASKELTSPYELEQGADTWVEIYPSTAVPVMHHTSTMGRYQRNRLLNYQRRRKNHKIQLARKYLDSVEAVGGLIRREGRRRHTELFHRWAEAPWWFSQLEDLHMTRQYWKDRALHVQRRFIKPGRTAFGRNHKVAKVKTKEFHQAWMKLHGVQHWHPERRRFAAAMKESLGTVALKGVDKIRVHTGARHKGTRRPTRQSRRPSVRRVVTRGQLFRNARIRKLLKKDLNLSV